MERDNDLQERIDDLRAEREKILHDLEELNKLESVPPEQLLAMRQPLSRARGKAAPLGTGYWSTVDALSSSWSPKEDYKLAAGMFHQQRLHLADTRTLDFLSKPSPRDTFNVSEGDEDLDENDLLQQECNLLRLELENLGRKEEFLRRHMGYTLEGIDELRPEETCPVNLGIMESQQSGGYYRSKYGIVLGSPFAPSSKTEILPEDETERLTRERDHIANEIHSFDDKEKMIWSRIGEDRRMRQEHGEMAKKTAYLQWDDEFSKGVTKEESVDSKELRKEKEVESTMSPKRDPLTLSQIQNNEKESRDVSFQFPESSTSVAPVEERKEKGYVPEIPVASVEDKGKEPVRDRPQEELVVETDHVQELSSESKEKEVCAADDNKKDEKEDGHVAEGEPVESVESRTTDTANQQTEPEEEVKEVTKEKVELPGVDVFIEQLKEGIAIFAKKGKKYWLTLIVEEDGPGILSWATAPGKKAVGTVLLRKVKAVGEPLNSKLPYGFELSFHEEGIAEVQLFGTCEIEYRIIVLALGSLIGTEVNVSVPDIDDFGSFFPICGLILLKVQISGSEFSSGLSMFVGTSRTSLSNRWIWLDVTSGSETISWSSAKGKKAQGHLMMSDATEIQVGVDKITERNFTKMINPRTHVLKKKHLNAARMECSKYALSVVGTSETVVLLAHSLLQFHIVKSVVSFLLLRQQS